jgi:hypothetical protein
LLGDNTVETAAKFHAIVALGDVALGAESQYFSIHVENVLGNLKMAAIKSLEKGKDEDEEETLR